jgi:hypothetical protein
LIIETQIINEMKNGLWYLFLVWDPEANNDNPILYKWFSAHLIAITDGKGLSTSKSFIIDSISINIWNRKENILKKIQFIWRAIKIRSSFKIKFRPVCEKNFWDHYIF